MMVQSLPVVSYKAKRTVTIGFTQPHSLWPLSFPAEAPTPGLRAVGAVGPCSRNPDQGGLR